MMDNSYQIEIWIYKEPKYGRQIQITLQLGQDFDVPDGWEHLDNFCLTIIGGQHENNIFR